MSKKRKQHHEGRHPHLAHLDKVSRLSAIASDRTAKKSARKAAKAELAQLRAEGQARFDAKDRAAQDAEIKARVLAKRAACEVSAELAQGTPAEASGSVSDSIRALGALQDDVAAQRKAREAKSASEQLATGRDVEPSSASLPEPPAAAAVADPVSEIVFAKPSEAPRTDFETNGLGQYLVKRPEDGRLVGYTRTTTYIDTLEDKSALVKWKMRILLEGVATGEGMLVEKVRELVRVRDAALEKAHKADRKGKLVHGELAERTDAAWGAFKREMTLLADEAFRLGGGSVKAQAGTDMHALCELYDLHGIDAVQDRLDSGEITPSQFQDVEAYGRACAALGLKVVSIEQVIVNDDLKVAGRLDRVVLARLPEVRHPKTGEILRPADARARRYVLDIKTGRVDFGQGKIAQQIRMYAESATYDLTTHERGSHGANRTTGLVLHLPIGSGEATVHLVDLTIGARGNKLSGEVRRFRSEGRKALDASIDLVTLATRASEGSEAP